VAVDLDGRVVDIDEHQVVDRSPQGLTRETGQHPAGYGIAQVGRDQRCRPQGRTQRRRCLGAVEDRADRRVPQQGHVINAVRTSDHPRHQRGHLAPRVRALVAGNTETLISQGTQSARLGHFVTPTRSPYLPHRLIEVSTQLGGSMRCQRRSHIPATSHFLYNLGRTYCRQGLAPVRQCSTVVTLLRRLRPGGRGLDGDPRCLFSTIW